MTNELEELLTEREVASILRRSVQALRNDRCAGRGVPYLKVCGSVRYSPRDLMAYLALRPRGGEQPKPQPAVEVYA